MLSEVSDRVAKMKIAYSCIFVSYFFYMVPLARFERAAHGLGNQKNVNSNPLILCLISRNY